MPKSTLGYIKELVDKFEARLLVIYEVKNGQKGPGLKRRSHAVVKAGAPA